MSFLAELKRRNVLRAAALYIAASWLLVQVATTVFPAFEVPDWVVRALVIALAIGFPFWLLFAWLYELTPQGLAREAPASPDAAPEPPRAVRRKLDITIIGVLLLAVALLLIDRTWRFSMPSSTPRSDGRSIAVLPFDNLSNDKDNDYFVTGMQDLILTRLSDIGGLKVISRTSTRQYASHPENLRQIATELGVSHVLEGSVQKHGKDVLINVQLIDAGTDSHLWADSYQRTLDNIFGVEGEVAQMIATELRTQLSPEETARLADKPTQNRAAYDLFLHAEYFATRGNTDYDTAAMQQAIDLYRQAVDQDPKFALAIAKLSRTESSRAWFLVGVDPEAAGLATQGCVDAERALALQPDLPETLLAIGYCKYRGKGDYDGALDAFAKALALRPNDANTLAARGYVLRRQGKLDQATTMLQRALTLDPRNSALAFELGITQMLARDYTAADPNLQRALALDPGNLNARLQRANLLVFAHGDVAGALDLLHGDNPQLRKQRAFILIWQRRYREALALLETIPDTPDNFANDYPKTLQLADLHRRLGEVALAAPLYRETLTTTQAQLKSLGDDDNSVSPAVAWQIIADAQLGLGQVDAALESISKSEKALADSGDQVYAPAAHQINATLYAEAGRADLAVPLLDQALSLPTGGAAYAPAMLWVDSAWDPIRDEPDFKALQARHADKVPAAVIEGTAQAASAETAVTKVN